MEEKEVELLSQMQSETKDIKANMATKKDIEEMATKDDIRRLEAELIRIGDKFDCKFEALIEGYNQNTKAIQEISKDVESLKFVVEQHEIKLKIVK